MTENVAPVLLVRPQEAAAMLAISARMLWTLTNTKATACVRIGRAVRYDPDDLRSWRDSQKQAI